jgi:hypothetical protein
VFQRKSSGLKRLALQEAPYATVMVNALNDMGVFTMWEPGWIPSWPWAAGKDGYCVLYGGFSALWEDRSGMILIGGIWEFPDARHAGLDVNWITFG